MAHGVLTYYSKRQRIPILQKTTELESLWSKTLCAVYGMSIWVKSRSKDGTYERRSQRQDCSGDV